MASLGILLMVKNEAANLPITLESVFPLASEIFLYDTGSEDNTVEVAEELVRSRNIRLHLKVEPPFQDFSTSRNRLMDWADELVRKGESRVTHYLWLDAADELRGASDLGNILSAGLGTGTEGSWHVQQHWNVGGQLGSLVFYNARLLAACSEWRYRGLVHEVLSHPKGVFTEVILPNSISIFQDRVAQNDGKTEARFSRDRELLQSEYERDPNEPRTVYYLAQTYGCLGQFAEAYRYYLIRSQQVNGFTEENFHSYLRMATILLEQPAANIDSELLIPGYLLSAFEIMRRAEPLVLLSRYYIKREKWVLAYDFAKLACDCPYPTEALLVIEGNAYDYDRWHLLSIAAYYAFKITRDFDCLKYGRAACERAISARNEDIDRNNLKFYSELIK